MVESRKRVGQSRREKENEKAHAVYIDTEPTDSSTRAREHDNSDRNDSEIDDILDSQSRSYNWLTDRPFSDKYHSLAVNWSKLPMYENKPKLREIVRSIREAEVTIIMSGTGSGKTVIVPKLALKHAVDVEINEALEKYIGLGSSAIDDETVKTLKVGGGGGERKGGVVAVTNPKSSMTEYNASYAAETLDVDIGQEVGYAFRGAPEGSSGPSTRLLFTTDGYLTAHSRNDPTFSKYSVIIVDEAHERTIYIDALLFMLRRAVQMRRQQGRELRVVIMSATFDPALFTQYFERENVVTRLIEVSGKENKPVTSVFLGDAKSPEDYIRGSGIRAVREALRTTSPGDDILFFVPTSKDAERGCAEVSAACERGKLVLNDDNVSSSSDPSGKFRSRSLGCEQMKCSALYAKMSKERQHEVTKQTVALPYNRRIIFATNIAESSLTINTLATVIDSGLELESTWVPETRATRMQKIMSTQAQMRQRKGRVGRIRPGTCYHLYTEAQMLAQPEYPDPTIVTVDLTDDVLTVSRDEGGFDKACKDYSEFITPPTSAQIASASAFLSFYRLMDVAERDSRYNPFTGYSHFYDIDFKRMASLPGGAREISEKYAGRVTPLGEALLEVMRRCKLGAWNALLVVSGMLFDEGDDDVRQNEINKTVASGGGKHRRPRYHDHQHPQLSQHLSTVISLASILEESSGDASMLWYDDTKSQTVLQKIKSKMSSMSEHASVLELFREISGSRRQQYVSAGIVSDGLIGKILAREEDMTSTIKMMHRLRKSVKEMAASGGGNPLARSLLFPSLRISNGDEENKSKRESKKTTAGSSSASASAASSSPTSSSSPAPLSAFEKTIIWARMYHVIVPASSSKSPSTKSPMTSPNKRGGGGVLPFSGGNTDHFDGYNPFTVAHLRVPYPESPGLVKSGTHFKKGHVALYESCMTSAMGTKVKTVTFFPADVFRSMWI